MRKSVLGVVLCLLAANSYSSSIWIEDNARSTVAGAESIQGIDSLTEIHGVLDANGIDTADVYRFQILPEDVGSPLLINVLSEAVNGRQANLWLFDGTGNGIRGVPSTSSNKTTMNVSGLLAGEYLFGVSIQGLVPHRDGGAIFDIDGYPFDVAGPLTGFGGPSSGVLFEYQIAISGASPLGIVPIPAAVWLFGSGLLGLIGVARKKANA